MRLELLNATVGQVEAVWLPHAGVWVTKGSSVPIALEGPDNQCSHSLETGSDKLFPQHEVSSHVQNYLYNFCHLAGFVPLQYLNG